MPRIPTERDREVRAALAAVEEFEDPAAWHRSRSGNLTRRWDDKTVTIFRRHGQYRWSISDEEQTRFSRQGYEAEEDALIGLREEVLWEYTT